MRAALAHPVIYTPHAEHTHHEKPALAGMVTEVLAVADGEMAPRYNLVVFPPNRPSESIDAVPHGEGPFSFRFLGEEEEKPLELTDEV